MCFRNSSPLSRDGTWPHRIPSPHRPDEAFADKKKAFAQKKASFEAVSKAAAKDAQILVDAGEGVLNTALTVGALGLLGFAATFFSGIKSQSDATTVVNFENSRPLTDAEKAKYKNLSASEKKKLGIKGF